MKNNSEKTDKKKIDWMITLVPLALITALCVVFMIVPEQSNAILSQIRFFLGDTSPAEISQRAYRNPGHQLKPFRVPLSCLHGQEPAIAFGVVTGAAEFIA